LKYKFLKLLQQIWFICRSVALRGLINSWRILRAELRAERFSDVKTSGFSYKSGSEGSSYQPASWHVLDKIFTALSADLFSFHFFDIGCGLGRVLLYAEKQGFPVLTGIELDKTLAAAARMNVERSRLSGKIAVYQHDATSFNYPDERSVYFLFNPFGSETLQKAVTRIRLTNKHPHWLIYMNPVHAKVLIDAGYRELNRVRTGLYVEAIIFSYGL
jgi:16S rRNA G966 N2-methylase RsmD